MATCFSISTLVDQAAHPAQAGRRRGVHARGQFLVGQGAVTLHLVEDAAVQFIKGTEGLGVFYD